MFSVTRETILYAAACHPNARPALKELFPDAFKPVFKPGDRIKFYGGTSTYVYLGTGPEAEAYARKLGVIPTTLSTESPIHWGLCNGQSTWFYERTMEQARLVEDTE